MLCSTLCVDDVSRSDLCVLSEVERSLHVQHVRSCFMFSCVSASREHQTSISFALVSSRVSSTPLVTNRIVARLSPFSLAFLLSPLLSSPLSLRFDRQSRALSSRTAPRVLSFSLLSFPLLSFLVLVHPYKSQAKLSSTSQSALRSSRSSRPSR